MNELILPLIAGIVIAFAVVVYVILDGFDLGIGILFPWVREESHRNDMINSVSPVWDGNETWLVLGGATLYGAFPLAYSTLLPALYMPIMFMLGALVFRGVAFEFRAKAYHTRFLWDLSFTGGSTVAAFCQGLILGAFIQGNFLQKGYVGIFAWLTPFSIMTGVAVVFGYALLGATWLIIKTEGDLQEDMYNAGRMLLVGLALFTLAVSLWTPFLHTEIMHRWFSLPNFFYLLPLPLITLVTLIYEGYALLYPDHYHEKLPFICTILLFVFCYIGLGISTWPYIVPRELTFWEAAAETKTLVFQLVGIFILLPVLIAYSIYAYRVFKGKVHPDHGYH